MLRAVASLISPWRGTLVSFRLEGLSETVCAPPSRKKAQPCGAGAAPDREVSCLGKVDRLTQRVWRQVLFRNFALALQHQLECIQQVGLGLVQGFTLRDGGRYLLDEASVSTLFGRFKYRRQFHGRRMSCRAVFGKVPQSFRSATCAIPCPQRRPILNWSKGGK